MRSPAFLPVLPFRPTLKPFHNQLSIRTLPSACHKHKNMAPIKTHPSFSNFFTTFFHSRHPFLAPRLCDQQIQLAATLCLFRYDTRLSVEFITEKVDTLSKTIADGSGKSIPEARRLFNNCVKDAAREYFKDGWQDVSKFVDANRTELTNVRIQSAKYTPHADQFVTDCLSDVEPVPEVDPVMLLTLLEQRPRHHRPPVMVMIYADYCSVCKQVRPLFEQAAKEMGKNFIFRKIDGPKSPEVKERYHFTSYPMILRCYSKTEFDLFPKSEFQMTLQNIVSFAKEEDLHPPEEEEDNISDDDISKLSTQRSKTYEWEAILSKQGIDEIDALRNHKPDILRPVMDSSLDAPACDDSSCPVSPSRSHDIENGDSPPLCILLGGGMGAGKSTAVQLITETPFWKKHGEGVVIVEADALKYNDNRFYVVQGVNSLASLIHRNSIDAAGDYFAKVVNARRDVVFDGTLSWSEYARQTIMMLRDTEYYWERGPGYIETEGGISEQYWIRTEKREQPAPGYRIELLGVTAHPEISVMRGIVRKITTGRSVPIPNQLKSHALFSKNFEEYIDMVDSAYLFDTTMDEQYVDCAGGYARQLVAIKSGLLFPNPDDDDDDNEFVVRNPVAYERFLMKKFINTNATSTSELYHSTVLTS